VILILNGLIKDPVEYKFKHVRTIREKEAIMGKGMWLKVHLNQ
jgi:hypothetical protein